MQASLIILAAALLFICQGVAEACSCMRTPSVCEAFAGADGVFIATVQSIENQMKKDEDGREYLARQIAHVAVEKAFKGIKETEAVFQTFGTSCDVQYEVGQHWLFYAHYDKKGKAWGISACGRSRMIDNRGDDLLYLQALPASAQRTRMSGTLTDSAGEPLMGVRVNLSGQGKTFKAFTDKNGVYEIYDLPPGRYGVTPEVPPHLKVRFSISSERIDYTDNQTISVTLAEKSCAEVNYYFSDNTSLGGKVFGTDGRAMPNVCLHLLRKENPSEGGILLNCTDKQGHYKIDEIPPGEYLIVANENGEISSEEPFPAVYYPGVFEKEKATSVTISVGSKLEDYDIHVPAQEATRIVQGVLLYTDGRPVADETVEFKADEVKKGYDGETNTQTDAQGRFSLTVLQGLKGSLRGFMYTYEGEYENCPQLDKLIREAGNGVPQIGTKPMKLEMNRDYQDIKLVFPFPSCVKSKRE